MKLSDSALTVLKARYFIGDEDWSGLCRRVSNHVANGDEELAEEYYNAIYNQYFLPNSPALMNAGTSIGNLSACFVRSPKDSMESIMETAKEASLLFKCISGNQKILTTNGIKNARDIAVHDIMFDSSGKENEVIDVIDSGTKKIYRITTDSGYSIDCSINHKVKSINENVDNHGRARKNIEAKYIEVSNLGIGDYVNIACPSYAGSYQKHGFTQQISNDKKDGRFKLSEINVPDVINEDVAWFLGFMVGDGNFHYDGIRFKLGIRDVDLIDRISEFIKSIGLTPHIKQYDTNILCEVWSRNFSQYIKTVLHDGKINVPNIIFKSPESVRASFLRGLFDSDGTISKQGAISYCSATPMLLKKVQALLLTLGIYSKFRHRENNHSGHNYLLIKTNDSKHMFMDKIGSFCAFKKDRMHEYPEHKIYDYLTVNGLKYDKISLIELIDECDTYNFTMNGIHEYNSMGIISKNSGGGVGMDFSSLREKDAPVKETSGVASGAVSFMEIFNTVAEVTKQGGKRRAAMMGSLRIDHPEILDFITVKNDRNKLNNFNLSVAITDDFMSKVKDNEYYNLVSPYSGEVVGKHKARDMFDFIALNAHKHGEPGLLFIDTINNRNPIPQFGKINTTNPCFNGDCELLTEDGYASFKHLYVKHGNKIFNIVNSEGKIEKAFVSLAGEKNTIRLRLSNGQNIGCTPDHRFYVNGKMIEAQNTKGLLIDALPNNKRLRVVDIENTGIQTVYDFACQSHKGVVDGCVVHNCGEIPAIDGSACVLSSLNISNIDTINNLDKHVRLAIRFLNGVIEVGTFPVPKVTEVAKTTRQIGLGIMGWADYLAQRGIIYGSEQAISEAHKLMSRIKQIAHDESVMIAIEKNDYIDTIDGKRYNGTLLSIAPTGTISMIADCSSSIEPYFALAYNKNVMDGESFTYLNEYLERDLRKLNLWTKDIVNDIVSTGSIQHIKVIPEHIRAIYRTANEISIEEHIKMQAAFQNHVCQAVSKTINLKQGADTQDVKDAYLLAYELGCKGITVYRDGSRGNQVLTTKQTQSEVCPDCNSELVIDGGCRTCKNCGWSACNI